MSWKSLEQHVRGIANLRWNAVCKPEHIDGVDFDCVVRVSNDEIIIIEITQERSLQKVRDDLNKINPTKIRLATQGLICRAFIVLEDEPTASMVEAGRMAHVEVCSAVTFERSFFDFSAYNALRIDLPFGSAVDSKTGENDPREFVPIRYTEADGSSSFSVSDLVSKLLRGGQIALTGDYGSGKSRCVREVYAALGSKVREAGAFPIAINLRDHWSSSNALEILAGHLGNIGLSSSIDNLVRLLNAGALILLLDGFDEIGAQSHDIRVDDRIGLRRHAVRGIRDLIQKSKAGILVTGRSHFFDSDDEMLQSLGLMGGRFDAALLKVPDNFTQSEGETYFRALGISAAVPNWLPRKPLVFQILVELDKQDVTRILTKEHGQFEFWGAFLNAVCVRESKGVAESIAPQTIRFILYKLAAKSRYSDVFLGRLTPRDIDEAYEWAVGTSPDQTGRQLLARMCTLGRIEPESPDRQFVDNNIVDILRAEHLVAEVVAMGDYDNKQKWKQSLRFIGAVHAASTIRSCDLEHLCFAYLMKFGHVANTSKLGEIVSTLTIFGEEKIDFKSLHLSHADIPILNLGGRVISNLKISSAVIGVIMLQGTPIKETDWFTLEGSLINTATGVSSQNGLPSWIKDTEVIDFDRMSNSARIKDSLLTAPQKLFLSIIHKIFFQPGAGREEASLLKGGYGQKYSPQLVDAILKMLLREKILEKFKGDDGLVYKPVRRFTERMNKIRSELTLSEDALWHEVTALSA
ncbi:NACHT domain-containing protein [Rhodanobacter sp. BL-MT-08]